MTNTELKKLVKESVKESLKELLFDSKIIETLMVEVISKVSKIQEVTAMGAGIGSIEAAPVPSDEFDPEEVGEDGEEKEAEVQLAENIANFWGKALGSDPAFNKVKVEARGKAYVPTELAEQKSKKNSNSKQIQVGGVVIPVGEQEEESNVDLGRNSFMGALLNSKKVRESVERYVPEEEERVAE